MTRERAASGTRSVDLQRLLTIDAGSELRKLSAAQLQGPWQIPTEIARRALRDGAARVEITTQRHGVTVVDTGRPISATTLQAAAAVLQPALGNEARHRALTTLEREGGLALLAIAGLPKRELRVEVCEADARWELVADVSHASLTRHPPNGLRRNVVTLRARALDRQQVVHWLQNTGRFCDREIVLDGRRLRSGWRNCLLHGPLDAPLVGRVGLPRDGEVARVWLLEHGIVTGHFSVPDAPVLEGALELGSDATDLSAARLREAAMPHIPQIVESVVRATCRLSDKLQQLPEPHRVRASRLLLSAARRRVCANEVAQVPVFRVRVQHKTGFASLAQLRKASDDESGGTRMLPALYPSQDPSKFSLGERLTLVADATERSALAELLALRFRPPNAKRTRRSLRARLQQLIRRGHTALDHAKYRLQHPLGARVIDESEYTPAERNLLAALISACPDTLEHVELVTGAGPICGTGSFSQPLRLPRDCPTVQASAQALIHDPSWAYPVALALLKSEQLPDVHAKQAWHLRTNR